MAVTGPHSVPGSVPIRQIAPSSPQAIEKPAETSPVTSPRDEVEISSAGQMLNELSQTSELRGERLERIKAAIADGTYETSDKLQAALDRLLDEIRSGDDSR